MNPQGAPAPGEGGSGPGAEARALGCVVGAMVGDAAGGVLEFIGRMPTDQEVEEAMSMPGGVVWELGPGQITDDTELALCLAAALAAHDPSDGFPYDAVAFQYGRWYNSPPFDIGMTTRYALSVAKRWGGRSPEPGMGEEMVKAAREHNSESLSNGALMRVSPLAAWAARLPEAQIVAAARADASLTHASPVAQDANAAYVLALCHLITNAGDAAGAVAAAERWARREAAPEVVEWLELAARPGPGPPVHSQAGFLRHGFVHAFRALHQKPTFEEGMRHIISLGGDVDTNAAIVGAALGALHSVDAIPARMKGPVLARGAGSPGRPRPGFLQGSVAEGLVRQVWARAEGGPPPYPA